MVPQERGTGRGQVREFDSHRRAHCNLGVLLENHKEDYDGAEQHYRRAIAIDPEHAEAHCNLDILLEQRKADCRHSAAGQPRPSWCL